MRHSDFIASALAAADHSLALPICLRGRPGTLLPILDRIAHHSHRIPLVVTGNSMRKVPRKP